MASFLARNRSLNCFLKLVLIIFLFCLCSARPALTAMRAFIVGIDRYDNLGEGRQLQRAVNDAEALSQVYSALGFVVTLKHNVSQSDFFLAFDAFIQSVEEGDILAFYFSGHGIQIGGLNYLLPADAPSPERTVEDLLKGRSIQLNALMDQLGSKRPSVRLVIVDACRDNPYRLAGRSIGGDRGLATVARVKGMFVMFSADAGQTALDRLPPPAVDTDKNSPYMRTLLPILREKGHTLPDIARRVRRELEELVAKVPHEQSPAYYDGISGDFCLTGGCKSAEQLKSEAEDRRQEQLRLVAELNRLQTEMQGVVKRSEEAERAMREAQKKAELAQVTAEDAANHANDRVAAVSPDTLTQPPSEQDLVAAQTERVRLTKQIEEHLLRLGCYKGPADGIWGDKVRRALIEFAEITKFNIPQDGPTQTALTVLSGRADAVCVAKAAPSSQPARTTNSKPNASRYSNGVWAPGTVPEGNTVSTMTPYGRLTCVGGNFNHGKRRECRWN